MFPLRSSQDWGLQVFFLFKTPIRLIPNDQPFKMGEVSRFDCVHRVCLAVAPPQVFLRIWMGSRSQKLLFKPLFYFNFWSYICIIAKKTLQNINVQLCFISRGFSVNQVYFSLLDPMHNSTKLHSTVANSLMIAKYINSLCEVPVHRLSIKCSSTLTRTNAKSNSNA